MASKLNRIGKDIMSAMKNATEQGTSAYDTTAEVRRIEGDIAWVHIAGGVDETPVKLTIAAKAGDSVQVRVGGGRAWITGNATAPPTDDRQANIATEKAELADTKVVIAQETADTAKKIADTAKEIAGDTNQYFWHTESGTDTGAHITEKPQEEFLDDPANGGGNLLARSNGIAVRDGLTELATFGASGAQIGGGDFACFIVSATKLEMLDSDGDSLVSFGGFPSGSFFTDTFTYSGHIGRLGADFALSHTVKHNSDLSMVKINGVPTTNYVRDGITLFITETLTVGDEITAEYPLQSPAYYYTLGVRKGNAGNYSSVQGLNNEASGVCAYAEGQRASAIGDFSHAEGNFTKALGVGSHAQNQQTVAAQAYQTVIGKYNDNQTDTAFEIGNGTGYETENRSNAFTVDWNGNIVASGGLTLNGDKTMTDFVTAQGYTTGGTGNHTWYYRKWASGMEEAWGMCSVSSVTGSVWTSPIYYYDWTVTYPSMFTSAPTQAYITSRNFQWTVVGHDVPTTTGMKMRLTKPVSSAQNIYVDIYLVHR